ncbi:MAG: ribbon-helix-helix domain-containing protein [Bifidobacteriaceae bacterium]|nr:ribbon-helix-helix domain-containing protein [Bifidobacteriaceae bacterium]
MHKTTIYLPDDLRARVRNAAITAGSSDVAIIREAIERGVPPMPRRPRVGLYASGDPISDRVDELLADGFGQS